MVIIELDGKEYQVKNRVNELTIGEFEMLNSKFENIRDIIDRWISIISSVSELTEEQLLEVESFKFQQLVNQMFTSKWGREKALYAELDGKLYKAKEKTTAKDMALLERILIKEKKHKISMIIASFFVADDEGKNQYELDLIAKKAEMMRELNCEEYIEYVYDSVSTFIDFIAKSAAPIKSEE